MLSDGQFHSGVELAENLGVSRTSIWKQVAAMEQLGVEIHKVRGRGYLIPGGIELLVPEDICSRMDQSALARFGEPQVFMDLDSTNRVAMDAVREGRFPYVCFAERQTAGRGRRGRQWFSPFGCNLYFSIVQGFENGFSGLEGLSLTIGLGVIRALQDQGISEAALKWPNDIVIAGRKLGGILIEVTGDVSGQCHAVIGVGLNLRMSGEDARHIDQAWANVESFTNGGVGRNQLAASLLNRLAEVLDIFVVDGFAQLLPEWDRVDALRDTEAKVLGAREVGGVCRGVDEKGGLLLETGEGLQVFYGGEVSVRCPR